MTWKKVSLDSLLERSIGGVWGEKQGEQEVDVRVWRVTELRAGGRLEPGTAAHRSVTHKQFGSRALQEGDLLLEKSGGGPKTPVGRVGLVRIVPEPAICANFMQLLRPDRAQVEPRYLHLYLNHFHDVGGTEPMQTASTNIRNIKATDYVKLQIPIPSLEEQRRIVAILEDHLSRLDAADSYLKTVLRRLESLEQSALERYFGCSDETVPLEQLVKRISAGKSFGGSNAPAALEEWGIIKVSAMTWGRFRAEENKAVPAGRVDPRFEIKRGDLLVSRANTAEYVGASVLVDEVRPRLLLSDKSLRLTPMPNVYPAWLWRVLQSPSARRQMRASATGTKDSMRNISQDALRKVLLPRRNREAQESAVEAFADVARSVAVSRQSIVEQLRRSAALRRSLLAAAFSGRLTGSSSEVSVVAGKMSA